MEIQNKTLNKTGNLVRRHDKIRDFLLSTSKQGNLECIKEETNLLSGSKDRPGDIYYPMFTCNRGLCVDVTVVSSFADGDANFILEKAAESKREKYSIRCRDNNMDFKPFVLDSMGCLHKESITFMKRLASSWSTAKGVAFGPASFSLLQKLSVLQMKIQGMFLHSKFGNSFKQIEALPPRVV